MLYKLQIPNYIFKKLRLERIINICSTHIETYKHIMYIRELCT